MKMTIEIVKPEHVEAFVAAINKMAALMDRALNIGMLESGTYDVDKGQDKAVISHGTQKPITLGEAITNLMAAKSSANRSEKYLENLKQFLTHFSRGRETTPLAEIGHEKIEEWLKQYDSAYTRQTWINRLSALFAFAVRRGYVQTNPCTRIEPVTVVRAAPKILTPEQAKLLLDTCDDKRRSAVSLVPYIVLGMYGGVRPEEIERLTWANLDLAQGIVKIDLAKTGRRRIVQLHPIAVKLLKPFENLSKAIAPSPATIRCWKRRTAHKILKIERWPSDLLRHTAASYLLALHKDAGKVATMLGNSSNILLTHYHEPVTEADCKAFWGL